MIRILGVLLSLSGCAIIQEYDEKGQIDRTILRPAGIVYTPKAPVVTVTGAGILITPFLVSAGVYKMSDMTPHATCSAVIIVDNVQAAMEWQGYIHNVNQICPTEGPK